MKSEFMIALTQLATERNLPREVILKTLEAALVSAFKKEGFANNQNISVKIMPQTGEVKVYTPKVVVEDPSDSHQEISLAEAQRWRKGIQIGEMVEVESTPPNAGRIAAQTAKQVVMQRLREAECDAIYGEYAEREGELVSGIIQRIEPRQILVNVGKTEAILPVAEQVGTERYRIGQRFKFYLKEVLHSGKGPQLIVSRAHPNLVRRLFELEVPEIGSGVVEIKAISRGGGQRSKVAVATSQDGVDPVGCCVGLRSIRIQNIIKELNGERIDIVQWDPSPAIFIANALSPAPVVEVKINEEEKAATVVVPDKQLSLAIGKEGQNARLAAKLTGWRIDIRSLSMTEVEKEAVVEEVAPEGEPPISEGAPELVAAGSDLIPPDLEIELEAPPAPSEAEPLATTGEILSALDRSIAKISQEVETTSPKSQLRFAEDLALKQLKPEDRAKKGKKKASPKRAVLENEEYETG